MRVMSCCCVGLSSVWENMVHCILGFCGVPVDVSFNPNNVSLNLVAVQKMSSSKVSSGVDHHQPAGLFTVSLKL